MSHFVRYWIAASTLVRSRRPPRDEAGVTTIEWLGLGAMMLLVLLGLNPQVQDLLRDVLDFFSERILRQE